MSLWNAWYNPDWIKQRIGGKHLWTTFPKPRVSIFTEPPCTTVRHHEVAEFLCLLCFYNPLELPCYLLPGTLWRITQHTTSDSSVTSATGHLFNIALSHLSARSYPLRSGTLCRVSLFIVFCLFLHTGIYTTWISDGRWLDYRTLAIWQEVRELHTSSR